MVERTWIPAYAGMTVNYCGIVLEFAGLLSRIARVLVKHKIHLHTAKINTLGERAEDMFLIEGAVLREPKTLLHLETDLIKTLHLAT